MSNANPFGQVHGLLRSRHIRASVLYTSERLISAIASFFLFATLARVYEPAAYGKWTFVLSIVQFAAPFLVSGLEPIAIRELVRRRSSTGLLLGSTAFVISVMTLIGLLAPLGYLWIVHGKDHHIMNIALIAAIAYLPNAFLVLELGLKALTRPSEVVIARTVAMWVALAIKLCFALGGFSLEFVALGLPAEVFIQVAILLYFSRTVPELRTQWTVSVTEAKLLARTCFPAILSGVCIMLFFRLNFIIVERTSSFREVGFYGFAFSLTQLAALIPGLCLSGIYPRLIQIHESDPVRYKRVIAWLFFAVAIFSYCSVAIMLLWGPYFIAHLFGPRYAPASLTATILFSSLIFSGSGAVRANIINIGYPQRFHLWSVLFGLVALLPISLPLTLQLGASGAAIGAVFGSFVSACATTIFIPQLRQWWKPQIAGLLLLTPFLKLASPGQTRDR